MSSAQKDVVEHSSAKQAVPRLQYESLAGIKEGGDLGYLGFYEETVAQNTHFNWYGIQREVL